MLTNPHLKNTEIGKCDTFADLSVQMIFVLVTQFHVFNMKVVVATLHQEELSVIMQLQTSRRFV